MRRRVLLAATAVAALSSEPVRAQQKAMPVIGFLGSGSPGPSAPFVAAFREGLGESGHAEGQNVAIEYRYAEGRQDRLSALAADLVGRKVDVIVAAGGPAPPARKRQVRRSRSSSSSAATRSRQDLSPACPGRRATSPALAGWPSS